MKVYGRANEILWDGMNNRVLARFKNGVFETSDQDLALILKKMGYKVEGLPERKGETVAEKAAVSSTKKKPAGRKKGV